MVLLGRLSASILKYFEFIEKLVIESFLGLPSSSGWRGLSQTEKEINGNGVKND